MRIFGQLFGLPFGLLCGLTSCGPPPRYTDEAAVAPALRRLDQDLDGRVTEAEHTRVAFAARPWAEVDTDGDGALSTAELISEIDQSDPVTFFSGERVDDAPGGPGPPPQPNAGPPAPIPPKTSAWNRRDGPIRGGRLPSPATPEGGAAGSAPSAQALSRPDTRWYLLALHAEIAAAKPGIVLPDVAEVIRVGDSGDLRSPEAVLLLGKLREAAAEAGVAWPAEP